MLAAIDAGSNTLRLLIGRIENDKVVPSLYVRRICRLAGGFTAAEGLSAEAMERTLFAFREFAEICQEHHVQRLRAVGTAAFRQAKNGESFADEVRSRTQLPLQVISAEAEAETMTAGVISALNPVPDNALIVDIGGGSTEFVVCSAGKVLWTHSLPLGVVRLIEEYSSQEARQHVISKALAELSDELASVCVSSGMDVSSLSLVGTAGTMTTLAALDQQMTEYDWKQINNYHMPLSKLLSWRDLLEPLTPSEREALPGMEPGRGDLIPAGIELLVCLMQQLHISSLTVSDYGILEGLLLSLQSTEYQRHFVDNPA